MYRSEADPNPDAYYQPATHASFPKAVKKAEVAPKAYDPHCQRPQDRADSDLCAQWQNAKVMAEANRLSRLSISITAWEFGALVLSLCFTGWAAWAAGRAASSADEAIETTRDIGEKQVRAYLACEDGEFKVLGGWVSCKINIRNFGQSPANKIRVVAKQFGTRLVDGDDGNLIAQHVPVSTESHFYCDVISPGTPQFATLLWQQSGMSHEYWQLLRMGNAQGYVCGELFWEDVFERPQSIKFTLFEVLPEAGLRAVFEGPRTRIMKVAPWPDNLIYDLAATQGSPGDPAT
ncbi:MAG: hypothetical protein GC166_11380 [Alphaproteobacteria bacterium]|nr:hypothetical protein [Alphaproteobacteria bacterium]